MKKRYKYVEWFCDDCDANLNRQVGFTTATGSWTCTECGSINDVTDNNILDEDEETYQNECPKCGGHLRRAVFLNDLWICEDCGAEAKEDDYGLLWTENDEDEEE